MSDQKFTVYGPILPAICRHGRSLIFVQSRDEAQRVGQLLIDSGITVYLHTQPNHTAALNFMDAHSTATRAALITIVPLMTHGVRVAAERAIWIGRVPLDTHSFAAFAQAMSRIDSIVDHALSDRPKFVLPEGTS